MRETPLQRKPVNKAKSAKAFRKNTEHTKAINVKRQGVAPGTMRGGIRL
jgi:hypothetical protein